MPSLGTYLAIADEAVDIGERIMTTGQAETVHDKGDRDFVTDLDLRIQAEIQAFLHRATPDVDFLGEEHGGGILDETADHVWALDPIDGTSNFAHGLPLCATSLALVHRGESVVGVVAAPLLGLRYHAVRGEGAYCGTGRITAADTTEPRRAIVSLGDYATGTRATEKNERRLTVTRALAENVERIRMFGAAALDLAWVAEGRTDACVILSNKPWDTAAGVLIAREAGAVVTDATGAPHRFSSRETIAASPGLSQQLLTLLA